MNMKDIKFSITIPAFKGRYLAEAIDSCLHQTYQNYEIVIVDDASPEDIKSIVAPYLSDSRVRFFRNEKNCGAVNVVDNWNICLGHCTGEYVICMGDDDKLLPNCLSDYISLMQQYPNLNVYHAWTEIIDENSNFYKLQEQRPIWESAMSFIWHRYNGRKNQFIGDFLFKREHLIHNGGYYFLPLAWSSDDVTAIRACIQGGIANTQNLGFQYRENRNTISNSGHYELKLLANVQKKQWFKEMYKSIDYETLSDTDKKYYQLNTNALEESFEERYLYYMSMDIKGNLFRVLKWIKKSNDLGIVKSLVFKSLGLAIARIILLR